MSSAYTFQVYTASGHRPYKQTGKNAMTALAALAKILAKDYMLGRIKKIEVVEPEDRCTCTGDGGCQCQCADCAISAAEAGR